jgi:hypothetical protein
VHSLPQQRCIQLRTDHGVRTSRLIPNTDDEMPAGGVGEAPGGIGQIGEKSASALHCRS